MRNRCAVMIGLVTTVAVALAAQASVAGQWNMMINTDQGANSATMTLQQDGETLTGEVSSDQGTIDLQGTITGDKVAFVMEIDAGGTFLEIKIDGTVAGDEMTGSLDFGGYGGGDWTAKRAG